MPIESTIERQLQPPDRRFGFIPREKGSGTTTIKRMTCIPQIDVSGSARNGREKKLKENGKTQAQE